MGSLYFLRAARKKECHSQMKIVQLHREVKYIHKPYYSSKHLTVGQPALIIKPKKKKWWRKGNTQHLWANPAHQEPCKI